jgi:hypothetical protein
MNAQEFSPRETMERVLTHWWIVLILTIMGGFVGWFFHSFQPPIYETTAGITINFHTENKELKTFDLDTALNAAGYVIYSTEVMDLLHVEALKQGFPQEVLDRLAQNTSVEAMESVWEIHVRDIDPRAAANYTNLWAGIAEKAMNASLEHALLAEQLQDQITALQSCLPVQTPTPDIFLPPVNCQSYNLDELNAHIQRWVPVMANEQELSMGILPNTTISLTRLAGIPDKPVLFGLAKLVLAGACIGFIISLWITNFPKVQRLD